MFIAGEIAIELRLFISDTFVLLRALTFFHD
jgi:hypothetical protein